MVRKYLAVIVMIGFVGFVLTGCGKAIVQKETVKPFYVQTIRANELPTTVSMTKYGKILGQEEIIVHAQANGKVAKIYPRVGDFVTATDTVISLGDTVANYSLQVQKAKNALMNTKLQHTTNKENLQTSLESARLALQKAKNDLQVTKILSAQQIKKAVLDLNNALTSGNSLTTLDIKTSVENVGNQVKTLKQQLNAQRQSIIFLIEKMLHKIDTLLGISKRYQTDNDTFEVYLGAKNVALKNQTEQELRNLYGELATLKQLSDNVAMSDDELQSQVALLADNYQNTKKLLTDMHDVLKASVSSLSFTQTTIDSHIAAIDGLQAERQQGFSTFVAYQNQVLGILGSDVNLTTDRVALIQESAKSKEQLLQIALETTKTNAKNSIFLAQQQLEMAQNNYDNLQATYDAQIGLLQNSIDTAEVSYQELLNRREKLIVQSPINGVISDILVDRGQEVNVGTPLFQIVSDQSQMVEVFVDKDEYRYVNEQTPTMIVYEGKRYTGQVLFVSSVANKQMLYQVQVALREPIKMLGDVVEVEFTVEPGKQLLPVNIVSHTKEGSGMVFVASCNLEASKKEQPIGGTGAKLQPDFTLGRIYVSLGKTRGKYIEIREKLQPDTEIILSSVEQFDEDKFVLKRKK